MRILETEFIIGTSLRSCCFVVPDNFNNLLPEQKKRETSVLIRSDLIKRGNKWKNMNNELCHYLTPKMTSDVDYWGIKITKTSELDHEEYVRKKATTDSFIMAKILDNKLDEVLTSFMDLLRVSIKLRGKEPAEQVLTKILLTLQTIKDTKNAKISGTS